MPRPKKCRKVCSLPKNNCFTPTNGDNTPVFLKVDEYETLRLIDRENFSQTQCGEYMHIARATVQQIYTSARKKIADALVEGRPIHITGGDYNLCDGKEQFCGCGGCQKHCKKITYNKGENCNMKIAIPLDENKIDVCQVLARATYFLFVENENEEIIENPASKAQGGAGLQVAQFLVDNNITVLITPRCGENAAEVFNVAQIKIYKSSNSTAAINVKECIEGKLELLTKFHGGFHGIQ